MKTTALLLLLPVLALPAVPLTAAVTAVGPAAGTDTTGSAPRADAHWAWPLGGPAGSGILYRPGESPDKESNPNSLFLGGTEGMPVIAPADGTIHWMGAVHSPALYEMFSNSLDKGSLDDAVRLFRRGSGAESLSDRDVTGLLSLRLSDGRKLHLTGLTGERVFRTGQRIRRGDTLGRLHWGYRRIGKPNLRISVSDAEGTAVDPMGGFGLPAAFRPVAWSRPETLSTAQASEDWRILMESYREFFPSLEQIISPDEFRALDESGKARFTGPVPYLEFYRWVRRSTARIHDSHLRIRNAESLLNERISGRQLQIPGLMPGWLGDSLYVCRTRPEYISCLGKAILRINGVPAGRIVEYLRRHSIGGYDSDTRSYPDQALATGWNLYSECEWLRALGPEDEWVLELSDGQRIRDRFSDILQVSALLPPIGTQTAQSAPAGNPPFGLSHPAPGTALLRLHRIDLDACELKAFRDSLRSVLDCPNLVLDLRGNTGGSARRMQDILRHLLPENPVPLYAETVINRPVAPELCRYTDNFIPGMEYTPQTPWEASPDGKYRIRTTYALTPDSLRYPGRIYVLTDENTASSGALLAAWIVRQGRGVSVGRETRSAYHSIHSLPVAVILPHSRLVVEIPLLRFTFDGTVTDRTPAGRGLLPDYPVPLTYDELYLHRSDPVLEYTLQLIETGRYLKPGPFSGIPPRIRKAERNTAPWRTAGIAAGIAVALFLFRKHQSKRI